MLARRYAWWREELRVVLTRPTGCTRAGVPRAGRTLGAHGLIDRPDDVFWMKAAEVTAVLDGRLRLARPRSRGSAPPPPRRPLSPLAPARDARRAAARRDAPTGGARRLAGTACSSGVAEGPVCVLRSLDRRPRCGPGSILVLEYSNPGWTPVFSMAVLEHIRYPFVLGKEVRRVLKPGGMYIGTVSFLEPFHGDSYYHHTYLGTYNTLATCGFDVIRVAPNRSWSGLRAQATMGGLFPRMPQALGRAIVWPLELVHKLWWKAGSLVSKDAGENRRLLTNTGSFEFVARKPANP